MKKKTKKLIKKIFIISGIILAVLLFFGLIWYGGTHGWFQSIINLNQNQSTPSPDDVESQYASYKNSLWFTPNTICKVDSTTGYLDTNIPNGVCTIFIMKEGWDIWDSINLNSNGDYSQSGIIDVVGVAHFIAVCCDSKGNCKISNEATLTVNDCNSICSDTDGGKMFYIGGKVTTKLGSMYDTCQPNKMDLLEFYCEDGVQKSMGIGCINGCQEGENGDYCKTVPDFIICHDGDVGIEPFEEQLQTVSTCHDNTQTVTDHCYEGTDSLIEYYCSPTGSPEAERTCDYVSYNCPGMLPGSHCENGACVY